MAQISDIQIDELIHMAKEMLQFSYTPYSGFKVGAALLAKTGEIFTGCNIENGAYSPTICAERCAFAKAVSQGIREFDAICIVGGHKGVIKGHCYPCGVCLQVMAEFCDPDDFNVITVDEAGDIRIMTLGEILPYGFTLEQ